MKCTSRYMQCECKSVSEHNLNYYGTGVKTSGYDQGLEDAAKLCDELFQARGVILAQKIRDLKSASPQGE